MARTIMVVDDDPNQLTLVELLLKRRGFVVVKADSGKLALSLLNSITPDMFILDVMMPDINGFDLCKSIRTRPQTATTPIIMLSAGFDLHGKYRPHDCGATAFISKGTQQKTLVMTINNILSSPILDNSAASS